MKNAFLPISQQDMQGRGWTELDIIIITGDAYVDHPSYGTAVIGRVLEDAGFRVGIIAQPDFKSVEDFRALGRPKLFFAVTAGNLDSMIANYTANKKLRGADEYSPAGTGRRRPDRAVIIYTNKAKEAYPGIPVVIGGMEASCRRLAHYDYWSDKVRRSILPDSKADILVYGMGESQILEIARRMRDAKAAIKDIADVRGTVIARGSVSDIKDALNIPSYEEVVASKDKFNEAFKLTYLNADPIRGRTIIQKHADRFIIQLPPAMPLSEEEMDRVYGLPYMRAPHPSYTKDGGVPGFEAIKNSIISHRGCPGQCSFCSLYLHQGRIVQSRSRKSIIDEIKHLATMPYFKGTVSDIGGPTANMYKAGCERWASEGACPGKKCLTPKKCPDLLCGYRETIELWKEAAKIPGVNHVFVGSGVRFDLLTHPDAREYIKELCAHHISGQLKVAPEHTEDAVLGIMNKTGFGSYVDFAKSFAEINARLGKKQYLVSYFIIAHPGSRLEDTLAMSLKLIKAGIYPEQVQDFIPLPMTASAAMYYTNKDPLSSKSVYVTHSLRERKMHRSLIQYREPDNKRYVIEALTKLGKLDMSKTFFRKPKGGHYGHKG